MTELAPLQSSFDVSHGSPIALVGISGRYPGAADLSQLWSNLTSGVDPVREPEGWRRYPDYFHPDHQRAGKTYSRYGGFLEGIDQFDADFFGISPREASRMDPQQRLVLEVSWEALEDAGIVPGSLSGTDTGVFVGISGADYLFLQMQDPNTLTAYSNAGGALSIAANRTSYFYNLHGPSMAIDTACSSALVAVHQACRSIWSGESSLALAGGVNLQLAAAASIGFSRASMLSPTGRCRAFDVSADGYVRSEGAGIVVLKPLSAAERDGDRIYGLILTTGSNSDGRTNGLSFPNQAAQESLLRTVYRRAGYSPEKVFYVEAHGTGTPAGDPVECEAIGRVLGMPRSDGDFCLIGSIKSNIGHCESASGIAGLTKVLLALQHRQLPGNLHFSSPNPKIPFDQLKLRVVSESTPIPERIEPVVMGVNSFGFGGSNAHVVVSEYRPPSRKQTTPRPSNRRDALLLLSAHTGDALKAMARAYAERMKAADISELDDICAAAALCRTQFAHRLATSGSTPAQIASQLEVFANDEMPARLAIGRVASATAKTAFVFSGNGSQWWGMGRGLLAADEDFRGAVTEIDAMFEPTAGWSLQAELNRGERNSRMRLTEVAQPCLFAVQVGLLAILRRAGINPAAVVGHSVGEVAAAYAAGILTLAQAVKLIFERSKWQAPTAGQGAMAAVGLGAAAAAEVIATDIGWVEIAAINSPQSVTLSGDSPALDRIGKRLEAGNIFFRKLALDYPFHSRAMDQIERPLIDALQDLQPQASVVPFISSVDGCLIEGTALGARYWWRNVREPVRFGAAITHLLNDGIQTFLEIGPHPVLREYLAQCAVESGAAPAILPTLKRSSLDTAEVDSIVTAICACHAHGASNTQELFALPATRVDLPFYSWQRQRHWQSADLPGIGPRQHPLLGHRIPAPGAVWESEIDPTLVHYLADHAVDGAIIFPAAGFIEMALAGAALLHGDAPCQIEDMEIRKALLVSNDVTTVLQLAIDESDGGFRISSRTTEAPTPSLLFTGRIAVVPGRAAPPSPSLDTIRSRLSIEVEQADHYREARARGLEYGPCFQGVGRQSVGDWESLSEIVPPARIVGELVNYRIHPCLLDACFQLPVGLKIGTLGLDSAAYLPMFVRCVRVFRPLLSVAGCYARLVVRKTRSITVDLTVVDDDGVVATIEGLRLQRVDFNRKIAPTLLSYRWRPTASDSRINAMPSLPAPAVIADAAAESLPVLMEKTQRRAYYSLMPQINRLTAIYAARAIEQLAGRREAFSPAAFVERGTVKREYAALFERLIEIAARGGYLRAAGQGWTFANDDPVPDSGPLWRKMFRAMPGLLPEVTLLARCGENIAAVMRGEINALELIFPEKGSGTAEHAYESSLSVQLYHLIAQAELRELVRRWPPERPMRILEIGAGTGGLTGNLLSALPPDRASYLFTDISGAFLNRAKQRFGGQGFVRFGTLDIERDPLSQGYLAESFDVVAASNVLHATSDLRNVLGNVHSLLAPGGHLLLVELHDYPILYILFGLLRTWWSFTDKDLRPSSPLLTATAWLELLKQTGFSNATPLSDEQILAREGLGPAMHSVILAQRASVSPSPSVSDAASEMLRTILVLQDSAGLGVRFGEDFASGLADRGHRVVRVQVDKPFTNLGSDRYTLDLHRPQDFDALFAGLADADIHCDEIVHLVGIGPLQDASTASLAAKQDLRCLTAIHLVQAAKRAAFKKTPRLWLVSARAFASPGSSVETMLPDPAQAPLWGLGRVLVNENPEFKCRMVDLSVPLDDPSAPALLVSELSATDEEDEVLLTASGRHVHRLRQTSLAEQASLYNYDGANAGSAETQDARPFQLESSASGIDQLLWRSAPHRKPGPCEVEIRVQAAGLNFRDVMSVMGMLPPEAVEESFHGTALGNEYAGEVVRVGPGVDEYKPGDRVMAMNSTPSVAFASHVVGNVDAMAPMPAALNFESAATIPAVFLTAFYGLDKLANLSEGERVLIHGAAGGVGLAAIQIAKFKGAEIFATAGTDEKRHILRMLGVHHVFDSRSLAFADEIMQITGGEGVDVVLNSLAGEAIYQNLRVLRPFGRFIEIGKRDLYANTKVGLRAFRKNVSFLALDVEGLVTLRPKLTRQILHEVADLISQGKLQSLPYRAFSMSRIADAFRTMQQSRHIGKLVVTMDGRAQIHPNLEDGFRIRPDATYLISGGLNGFGLATAKLLAARGARNFALIGRRGAATDEAPAAIAEIEADGGSVRAFAADVTDGDAVEKVIADIERHMPPIGGVIHSAMVLDDGILLNLDRARLHAVLAPKMLGAWNLHRFTLNRPLDFFILYGSATTMFGNPGQAAYGAANLYLEALAAYRRALGLPALTVGWTRISQAGYLTRNTEMMARLERIGLRGALSPEQAVEELGRLLAVNAETVAMADFEWSALKGWRAAEMPRLQELVSVAAQAESSTLKSDFEVAISALPENERLVFIATRLQEHIARVLATSAAQLDLDRPLSEIGLDSLMGVELGALIERDMTVDVSLMELMQSGTINSLATRVYKARLGTSSDAGKKSDASPTSAAPQLQSAREGGLTKVAVFPAPRALDLPAEAVLPSDINAKSLPPVRSGPPGTILLTGATGYLGRYLLADLLRVTDARVLCLVRARSAEEGQRRLTAQLSRLPETAQYLSRIEVIPANLAEPGFGLDTARFQQLCSEVDVIYHLAAVVNFLEPYEALKPVNVQAAQSILRLASTLRRKQVHFVSSSSVFMSPGYVKRALLPEGEKLDHWNGLPNGYTQTKWVADRLMTEAMSRDIPVSIFRPGFIAGDSRTGVCKLEDVPPRLIKAWVQLGMAPRLPGPVLDMTPVDVIASAIVRLSTRQDSPGKTYNLTNPNPISFDRLVEWTRAYGYPIELVSLHEWLEKVQSTDDSALTILRAMAVAGVDELFSLPPYERRNTVSGLSDRSFAWPAVESLLDTYFAYFVESGFLKVPIRSSARHPAYRAAE
jgi:phthiocerol/phenolphthiocerol synthesis type-I polyketide synthase C